MERDILGFMKSAKKLNLKLTPRQKKELKKRIYALRGKYKGKGLMKALMIEKKRESEF